MSDPVQNIGKSQPPPPDQSPKSPPPEFKENEEDQASLSILEKELINKYGFSRKEADAFNKNFIQLSMQAMKSDMDKMTQDIKKMFKEDEQ